MAPAAAQPAEPRKRSDRTTSRSPGAAPPMAEIPVQFAGRMQEALVAVLSDPRDAPDLAGRVARAREELDWFLLRLRRVVDESAEVSGSRSSGLQERVSARVRMTAWVRRGAEVSAPAAVVGGGVGTMAGPVGGLAAGLGAAGVEAVKQVTTTVKDEVRPSGEDGGTTLVW